MYERNEGLYFDKERLANWEGVKAFPGVILPIDGQDPSSPMKKLETAPARKRGDEDYGPGARSELMEFLVAQLRRHPVLSWWRRITVAVAAASAVIALRNPVHAARVPALTFLMVAVLFIMNHAEFLAAVQVLVYAGGIMVLYLFVIMLVKVKGSEAGDGVPVRTSDRWRWSAVC